MKTITLPTMDEMKDVLAIVTDGGKRPIREWAKGFRPNLADHLRKYPEQYRNFGPYWWLVKHILLEGGFAPFGQDVDAEMVEAMEHENGMLYSLVAGVAYYEWSMENHFIGQTTHTIVDNGEDTEYTVYDHDAELYIQAQGGSK